MTLFLSGSLRSTDGSELNPANGFVEKLKNFLPPELRVLYICSDPRLHEVTDRYADEIRSCLVHAGFDLKTFDVLDGRNEEKAAALIRNADLVILAGGHVPTQNAFFHSVGLPALLRDYGGVVLGTSAGSMNCAHTVYAHPEFESEVTSPDYVRFIRGLGLTNISILPHYDELQNLVLAGKHVLHDIAVPDSMGREFIAIPDGTFLICTKDRTEIRGESYRIKDGTITPLQSVSELFQSV